MRVMVLVKASEEIRVGAVAHDGELPEMSGFNEAAGFWIWQVDAMQESAAR